MRTMTDPIVKQALLDLCDVMRELTKFVERINQRVYALEDKHMPRKPRIPTAAESNARFNREN
jgi:hypothetical protein